MAIIPLHADIISRPLHTTYQWQQALMSIDNHPYGVGDIRHVYAISDIIQGIPQNGDRKRFCENKRYLLLCQFLESNDYPIITTKNHSIFAKWLSSRIRFKKHPNTTLVVHLRIGDSITRNLTRYFHPISYYRSTLSIPNGIRDVVLVAGIHTRIQRKHTEVDNNARYVQDVARVFEQRSYRVFLLVDTSADDALVFMARALYFAKSGGGFSKLVSNVVRYMGGTVL